VSGNVIILGPRGEALSTPKTRRAAALRTVKARFDAAMTTDENSRWWQAADFIGPLSELDPGTRRTLRSRARYECANNGYAAGMLRTLAVDTIGTGPGLQIVDYEIPRGDAVAVEDSFWEWCGAVRFAEKLRLMRMAKARDGESFAQFFENPRVAHPVRFDFNPFEADMVATTMYNTTIENILDGLFVDDYGNVTAYNVLRQHPGENYLTMILKADVVPARDIIDVAHINRPGAYRGVPEILAALPLFALLRRYTLAVCRSAESAAEIAWFLKTQQAPSEMTFSDPFDLLDTERGMGMVLPEGYEAMQLKAEQPTTQYPQFKREILSEIARCLGVPYNVAAGDSSSYNYSSGRLDARNYQKTIRVERSYWENVALEPLFRRWWSEAILEDPAIPEGLRRARPPRHAWTWDGEEHIDPLKESKADTTDLTSGATTLATIYARKGLDWEEALRQRAREIALCRELGIPIPGEPLAAGLPAPVDEATLEDMAKQAAEEQAEETSNA